MEKFQLSLLFNIIGIGSASGLLYHNELLYIISDNSTFLYEYNLSDQNLRKIALVDIPEENIPKKIKPDFESITKWEQSIVVLGSGSTSNRNLIFQYNPELRKHEKTTLQSFTKKSSTSSISKTMNSI